MHKHFRFLCALALLCLTITVGATVQDGGVNTVGRAFTKRNAMLGRLPKPETVVVADLINYHRHGIPLPKGGAPIALDLRWDNPLPAQWGEAILQVGMATTRVHDEAHLVPLNLALVIDCSGSMQAGDKLNRVRTALTRFVGRLRPTDRLSIVRYANEAGIVWPSAPVGDGHEVLAAIRSLEADGSTNLHAGLMCGYRQVSANALERETGEQANRVILLTDGIANSGVTDSAQIAAASRRFNEAGIDLSTIGFGSDFNYALLKTLAQAGRGSFHFVADDADIEKVFAAEAQSLMGMVARNVSLHIEAHPALEILHVYGHDIAATEPGAISSEVRIPLDNFNYGMTRVVLLKIRRRTLRTPAPIKIALRFDLPGKSGSRAMHASTVFHDPALETPVIDHEVRKNFTIAVMARGLRRMAQAAEEGQLGQADAYLRRAREFAREQYPATEDPDIVEILGMLDRFQGALTSHVEVYRDL